MADLYSSNPMTTLARMITARNPKDADPFDYQNSIGTAEQPQGQPDSAPNPNDSVQQQQPSDTDQTISALRSIAGNSNLNSGNADMIRDWLGQMKSNVSPLIQKQSAGLDKLQGAVDNYANTPRETNLMPLAGFLDNLAGQYSPNAQKYIKQPETEAEKQQMIAKLQDMVQKGQGDLTKDQIAEFQTRLLPALASQGYKQQNLDFRELQSGQKQYDSRILPIAQTMEGGIRAGSLIKEGMRPDGSFVINPQLVRTLTEEESKLATGKQNYSEGTAEGLLIRSAQGDMGKLLQYYENAPNGVLSPENAKQMLGVYNHMLNNYKDFHDRTVGNLLGGANPVQSDAIKGRAAAFHQQYDPLLNSIKPTNNSKPNTVTQNGHTYTLNPQTGNYE